jgi:hypothetical protein
MALEILAFPTTWSAKPIDRKGFFRAESPSLPGPSRNPGLAKNRDPTKRPVRATSRAGA